MCFYVLTVVPVRGRLPGGPVGPDGPGAEPLAVHEGDGVLRLHLLGEGHEAVALGLERLGVPDHAAVSVKEKNKDKTN